VEDICASGGYFVAVGADRIYVNKASIVGSIGVCSGAHPLRALQALEPLACLKTVCELRPWLQKHA
jgi:ClpP class serine protease